ncbi:hypothetical protein ACUN7V_20805 [Quadrisphaera oryzae]|uniref:hypothetical protein n=1 Tax=Quadrisphaera TaxID=317661 RepID=UPI0016492FBA|nr:hypothetical protein [Quadrisphaera sp. RL12-1S]MBC3760964.1 hypothetical protein [Quadrisphaera sp. RL12-1S]
MHVTPARHLALHRVRWWTRWREARAARAGLWCTVDPWDQDDDGDGDRAVLRAVLHALRPWADQLQTDLPLAMRGEWPAGFVAAADHLHAVSPRHRGDTDGYATTGWLPAHDDATWAAFVLLAPHVLDADVMTDAGCVVVGIADQGTSLALRLTAEQRQAVVAVLGDRRLRPLR